MPTRYTGDPFDLFEACTWLLEHAVGFRVIFSNLNGKAEARFLAVLTHEPSRLQTILHPNDPANRTKIHEIATAYSTRFQREMVLVTMSPALASSVVA